MCLFILHDGLKRNCWVLLVMALFRKRHCAPAEPKRWKQKSTSPILSPKATQFASPRGEISRTPQSGLCGLYTMDSRIIWPSLFFEHPLFQCISAKNLTTQLLPPVKAMQTHRKTISLKKKKRTRKKQDGEENGTRVYF